MRLLHDRLPLRRQEHPGEELPGSGGIGWRTSTSDDHRDRLRAALRRAVGGPHRAHRPHRCATQAAERSPPPTWCWRPARSGTQKLLFKMRDKGKLPKLSDKLGVLTRTNSESIVGAGQLKVSPDLDLTHGVAITSSIHPTSDTHIEPVRYGKGSNAMGLLQTLMTDGAGPTGTDVPRWKQLFDSAARGPARHAADAQPAALERAHRDRAGHAAPGQLDHHVHQARQARLPPADRASRATASRTRRGSRSATRSPAASPRRSTASPAAPGASCSTSR